VLVVTNNVALEPAVLTHSILGTLPAYVPDGSMFNTLATALSSSVCRAFVTSDHGLDESLNARTGAVAGALASTMNRPGVVLSGVEEPVAELSFIVNPPLNVIA
jgi:hypothetical protein